MKLTKKQLFEKVETIAKKVKDDLKISGYVVPVRERDGSINFDGYRVKKKDNFYTIYNKKNQPIHEQINLIQTAVLTANALALGRWPDDKILNEDKQYGYQEFKLEVYTTRINKAVKDSDDWVYYDTRRNIAKRRSIEHKNFVDKSYKKLTALR